MVELKGCMGKRDEVTVIEARKKEVKQLLLGWEIWAVHMKDVF